MLITCGNCGEKMTKKFIKQQEEKLKEKQKSLETELKSFAKKDPDIKENWETKFPDFGARTADPSEQTDQLEEYEATLPVEYVLEVSLKQVKQALEQIKKGTYGICQNCGKKIRIERLRAYPEAILCTKCAKRT